MALDGRNGDIWRRYSVYRWTQERIADHYGVTQQTVSEIIRRVREALPVDDLAEMRKQSLELYAELTARAMEIADMVPVPVFVGKDGSIAYDPDGNVVRDYTGRLRALETAAKFDAETRKLMGLDAASKQEISSQVRYEIAGISTDDLT